MSTNSERLTRLIAKQEEARAARESLKDKRSAIVLAAEDEGRDDLNESEDTEFRALTEQIKAIDEEILARDEVITSAAEEEKRAENADRAFKKLGLIESQIRVNKEATTYERGNGRSYFADLVKAQISQDLDARSRLERHAVESQFEARTNPNRTDGQGGYFVPPVWLMDEYAAYLRAGRPTADIIGSRQLPPGQDSINLPKIATGSTAAIQTADAASVSSTDITDSTVSAGVKTIAGQQDVAIQLVDQSPLNFDEIVFADLIADLNMKTDQQVLSGSNASGQVKGILTYTTGISTSAWTGTTGGSFNSAIAGAINNVHANRYLAPDTIVMHPRRWAFLLGATDTTGRPLVASSGSPMNPVAGFGGVAAQGIVGNIQGLDVIVDPNVPTNLGASTNEDRVIVFRRSDLMLWEGALNTRVLPDVLSGTLQIRLQVYRYVAFMADRYPQSINVLQGTGLVAPTFG